MADSILKRAGEALGISKRAVPTGTIGSSVTSVGDGAGTFDEPDRNIALQGTRRFAEYDRMVRDVAIVGTGVRLVLNLISNAVWTVNPPEGLSDNEAAVAQGYADTAYEILFSMTTSWSAIARRLAAAKFQGFTLMEWTAVRRTDGVIGLKDIEHRPQRTITRWKRDEGGTVEAVVQRIPGRNEVTIPRSKLVYAVDDTLTDSPEGLGLFRHLAVTAQRLEEFLKLEKIGFTTDLRGIPIARAPLNELQKEVVDAGTAGSEARRKAEARRVGVLRPLRDFLTKHIRSEATGILLSSDTYVATAPDKGQTPSSVPKWALELLTGDSTSFDSIANAIKRMIEELARLMGCEHLLLGSEGAGSLALARSKVGTFYLTVTSILLDTLEVVDRDVLGPISELNGWEEHLRPEMGVNEISDRDIEQLLDALAKLAQAGAPVMPDDPGVGEIYDLLGLTRPPERGDDMDLSLNPGRNDPNDPDKPIENNPEDQPVRKRRVLRSRRNMQKRRKAW